MGARQKLNASYFGGSLLVAVLAGAVTESWWVFLMALGVLLAINVYTREIRPGNSGKHSAIDRP